MHMQTYILGRRTGRGGGLYDFHEKTHVPIKESPQSEVNLQHVLLRCLGWRNVLVCVCVCSSTHVEVTVDWDCCHKIWCCNISRYANIPVRRLHGFTSVYHEQIQKSFKIITSCRQSRTQKIIFLAFPSHGTDTTIALGLI